MSAFVLDKLDILYLVQAARSEQIGNRVFAPFMWWSDEGPRALGVGPEYDEEAIRIANVLWQFNGYAVRKRYPTGPLPGPVGVEKFEIGKEVLKPLWKWFDPIRVYKVACMYEGQLDAVWDEYLQSEVFTFLVMLRHRCVMALPGYDDVPSEAPWPDLE